MPSKSFVVLKNDIKNCRTCAHYLQVPPKPVVQIHPDARILVISQAPGTRARDSGKPFFDASGDRLRGWLGVDRGIFYNEKLFACMPMGFCYPGKSGGGDLPPCRDCAPLWHPKILDHLTKIELTLYVGSYALNYYCNSTSMTKTVCEWREHFPTHLPLPHPSWHNNAWLGKHSWFMEEVVPALQKRVHQILKSS